MRVQVNNTKMPTESDRITRVETKLDNLKESLDDLKESQRKMDGKMDTFIQRSDERSDQRYSLKWVETTMKGILAAVFTGLVSVFVWLIQKK